MEVWITTRWECGGDTEVIAVHAEECDSIAAVELLIAADEGSTWRRCEKPFKDDHEWATRGENYGIYIKRHAVK
jgi:hypothetical protein